MKQSAYFEYKTTNLGDDIQSLAAKQFLPHDSIRIDRDNMSRTKENVFVIANGWFMHNSGATPKEKDLCPDIPFNWPPPPNVNALLISMHLAEKAKAVFLTEASLSYLQANGPVGCRDLSTKHVLDAVGVDTYFSSCLTLTLKKPVCKRTSNVYFVDIGCSATYSAFIDKMNNVYEEHTIEEILYRSFGKKPCFVTHCTSDLDPDKREKRARELLDLYASAKLVVTSRLHCALPCLALGTPVIFVVPDRSDPRFSGLLNLLTTYSHQDIKKGKFAMNWDNPHSNSDAYVVYAKALEVRVSTFVHDNLSSR